MKYRNVKKYYPSMELQLFAEGDGGDGGDAGEGDDLSGEEETDEDGDTQQEEKQFSQKDMDEAVKKRLAREKRRWQREQQKDAGEPDNKNKAKSGEEDKDTQELREKAQKAEELELKWTCLEHEVGKSCVDDVLALARVHMAKNKDTDIEDAIDEVLKKYPQFKESSGKEEDEEETPKKSWGERQRGRGTKLSGVENAFLKKNPGLKFE